MTWSLWHVHQVMREFFESSPSRNATSSEPTVTADFEVMRQRLLDCLDSFTRLLQLVFNMNIPCAIRTSTVGPGRRPNSLGCLVKFIRVTHEILSQVLVRSSIPTLILLMNWLLFWKINPLQWNFDIIKGHGTGKICLKEQGFVILRFFSIYFTITGAKNIVHYTKDFVI